MAEDVELRLQPLLDEDTTEMELVSLKPEGQRRRFWLVPLIIGLLVVLIGGGVLLYAQFTKPPAVQFTQVAATVGNISQKISATGPIGANAQYNMNFSASGQVREIDVQIGQHVKQGQILAKLNVDMTALQDSLNQAQLGVSSAQTSLNSAEASDGNAQSSNATALNLAREQEQNDLNTCKTEPNPPANCVQMAQDKLAQAQNQANSSNSSAWSQVTSAQGALARAVAQLQAAQHSLDSANASANMTAPVDATVAAINGAIGQSTGSGASGSSSQPLMILTDTSKLTITAQVNEADIGNVQVGQPAQFTVTSYPTGLFRASVSAIETIGQTTSNVVTYPVLLTVDQGSQNGLRLFPGMTATVNITTAQRIGVVMIPSAALSFPTIALQNGEIARSAIASIFGGQRGQTGQTGTQGTGTSATSQRVVLQLRNGQLTPTVITTGLNNGQFVEVVSGLNEGSQVVTGQTGGTTTTTTTGRGAGGAGGFGGGAGGFGGGGGGGGAGGGRVGGGGG